MLSFYYFTLEKMNYQTEKMESALLMEDVNVGRHETLERERSFYLPHEVIYSENVILFTAPEYIELQSLLDGTSKNKGFKSESKEYWVKLLANATAKCVLL